MMDLQSRNDIDKISFDILRSSKSLGVFPTPVDNIVLFSDLVFRKDIDVSQIHSDYFARNADVLKRALSKVRGMLDRSEKTIYLDLSQKKERRNFVKLHEVGHQVLPWQAKVHSLLDDDDDSLSDCTNEEFEAEANYFASRTLFQLDRFNDELDKLPLGMPSSIQLAKLFGSSIHAALRRYIECSKNRCALIVLENISPRGQQVGCDVRNIFLSVKFRKTFGKLLIPEHLGYTWSFVQDYYFKKRYKLDGLITLSTEEGEADFHYQFFNNTYNAFVFIFPIGEHKRSTTKIIIK